MLTHQQIQHFQAFGFVVLRGLLDAAEAAGLHDEVETGLRAAFGERYGRSDGPDGVSGDYLALMTEGTLSASLVADDPRLWQASQHLLGRATVPTFAEAVLFITNAPWHCDDGTDVGGVKFLTYLEPRTADTGALRVLPGSHHAGSTDWLYPYLRQSPRSLGFPECDEWPVPGVVLETEPGDVIAFDVHLFHSSSGGHDRLAWSVQYLPFPMLGDHDRVRAVKASLLEHADMSHHGYDEERWPVWRDWARNQPQSPARDNAITRLRLMGALEGA